jgi:hypothetical protein
MGGANISGAGSFESNDADVSGPMVSNSVDTGSINSTTITNSGKVETQDLTVNGSTTGIPSGGASEEARAFASSIGSTATVVPLDSVSYDPNGRFDTTNFQYNVPSSGLYFMYAQLLSDNDGDDNRVIIQDGTGTELSRGQNGPSETFASSAVTDIRKLNSGQSIQMINDRPVPIRGTETETFFIIAKLA